jgi:excisionase family DNA binding protein
LHHESRANKAELFVFLTEEQAAKEVQVDRRTIRRLIDSGRLKATDFGSGGRRLYRIDIADLKAIANPGHNDKTAMPLQPTRSRRRARSALLAPAAAYLPSV